MEYGEFVTNFRDHIESQVFDDSQRLTRLLAQCVGKARDAIKSCVNLPIGQRYNEAWKTLSKNFRQPHMVADAQMKRLRKYNLRRVDAASLMDFARKLEITKRVLTSMGPLYVSRLNNEDAILMLMKNLPDEGLKRKWTNIAGDLICSKGQVDFSDFVNFIQKQADRLNRFGQELKSTPPQHEKERRHGNKEKQDLPFKATTLATQSKGNRKSAHTGSATLKCSVLDLTQFGSVRLLRAHLTKIDCEPYNRRNCVEVALHMDTFQDLARRDFLVRSQDVERSTISFFTLLTMKRPTTAQ